MHHLVLSFFIGACLGSFILAMVMRMHNSEKLVLDRSRCDSCKNKLRGIDLIPLLSFIFLKGRCSSCKQSLGWLYFFVEIISGLLFAHLYVYLISASLFSFENILFYGLVLMASIFFFLYDYLYFLVPDKIILPLIGIFFGINVFLINSFTFYEGILACLVGAGFFLIQFILTKGKAIGGGDIRFGALMGVILGYPAVLIGLFISYILASIISIYLLIFKGASGKTRLPLVTFLSIGLYVVLLYYTDIKNLYLSLVL